MADGKANRNILPYNNYRSGLRAGRAFERNHAAEAFKKIIEEENIASSEKAERLEKRFMELLRAEELPQ